LLSRAMPKASHRTLPPLCATRSACSTTSGSAPSSAPPSSPGSSRSTSRGCGPGFSTCSRRTVRHQRRSRRDAAAARPHAR
jgi:hypothetical protein